MAKVDVTIPEGDRPNLRFYSREWLFDTVAGKWKKFAIDLTGATLNLNVKQSVDGADIANISGVIIAPATNGEWTAQVTAVCTASPGLFAYRAVVTRGGNPLTIQHGEWNVENT